MLMLVGSLSRVQVGRQASIARCRIQEAFNEEVSSLQSSVLAEGSLPEVAALLDGSAKALRSSSETTLNAA